MKAEKKCEVCLDTLLSGGQTGLYSFEDAEIERRIIERCNRSPGRRLQQGFNPVATPGLKKTKENRYEQRTNHYRREF